MTALGRMVQRGKLAVERKQHEGKTYAQTARDEGWDVNTTRRYVQAFEAAVAQHYSPKAQKLFTVHVPAPLELTDDAMVVGDVHVPATSLLWNERMMAVAQRFGIKQLIVAGDFTMLDVFSGYPKVLTTHAWKQEKRAGRVLITRWLRDQELAA